MRGVQHTPQVGDAGRMVATRGSRGAAPAARDGRGQRAGAPSAGPVARGRARTGGQQFPVDTAGHSRPRGRLEDREWVSGRRAAARAAEPDSGSSAGSGDFSASPEREEAGSAIESGRAVRGALAFGLEHDEQGPRGASSSQRARARAQPRTGHPSGGGSGRRAARDGGQSAGRRGSGDRRASAAQRIARACRELGAAAAELELGPERERGRTVTAHSARGARRAPQAWAGPSSVLSSTEDRSERDGADSVADEDWLEDNEGSGSERSIASGELVQSISVSTTSSSSRSSSSSASSSSLASQASDADSTARARKEAEKLAKRAARQQKRRKRRRRLSVEERRAKKRRDLPGVVRCEYTAVMRGLRDSCRKKICRGDFVDLFVLTRAMKRDYKAAAAKTGMGTEAFRSFDNWLAGFWVFAACYLEDRPEEHMNIIRYLHLVHDMQRTSAGSEWRQYDQEFREKQDGLRVMDFGFKDVEVWLKVTRASQQEAEPQKQGTGVRRAGSSAQGAAADGGMARTGGLAARGGGRSATRGKCFAFNSGTCSYGKQCRFRHSCHHCGGAHPASSCFKGGRQGSKGKQPYSKQTASGTAQQSPNAS
ncbi:uncharacterized protein LOC134911033 [Pseudophryne corroboree]|uniref:uncharacterized protein LOC134911033 n=1 Tax=Pseudophryne corroboree TaxID=495146 RepID=UPI0030812AD9